MRVNALVTSMLVVLLALAGSSAASAGQSARTGGAEFSEQEAAPAKPIVAGDTAKIIKGVAHAPAAAPAAVQNAVWAANKIVGKPYRYGGGHARFRDTGYDCSGTISFALNGADVLDSPLDSSSFMGWGEAGKGAWITVYTNPGHAFVVIAGLRLDTSAANDPSGRKGPRWRPALRSTSGFTARHPEGL